MSFSFRWAYSKCYGIFFFVWADGVLQAQGFSSITFAVRFSMPGIVRPTGAPMYVGSHIVKRRPLTVT